MKMKTVRIALTCYWWSYEIQASGWQSYDFLLQVLTSSLAVGYDMKLGYDHRRSYYLLQNGNEDRRDYVHHYRRSYRSQVSNWLLLHILTGPRVTEADLKQEYAHHVRNNDRTNSPASHNKMDLDTITGTGLAVANIFTSTDLIGLGRRSVLYHEKSPCVRLLLPQGCGLPFVSRHPSRLGKNP